MQELSLARDMERVMHIAQTTALGLTRAQAAAFIVRENDSCFYADEQTDTPLWKGQRFPLGHCVGGWAMINNTAVAIGDVYKDERISSDVYHSTFVKSLAIVPIRMENPVGAVGVYWDQAHSATEDEMRLLRLLADGVAIAIGNVNTCTELKDTIEELDLFTYKSAHDMRSPIASILGLAHLAESETENTEATREYIAKIKQQTERLDSVLQQLVQTTRSRQGAKEIV
ncbi:MAG TPA: GAF domain-containing protein, partial [Bacteroidia bacterium]|nr:GAF domain-containing protein [Bacteroidia bacterium]